MPLPQPLVGPCGPQGVADIEQLLKETRFVPGLAWLLRTRGVDMAVERGPTSPAPLVTGAPHAADTMAEAARNIYGSFSSFAPARPTDPRTAVPANPTNVPNNPPGANPQFVCRVLIMDDEYTESDQLFGSSFQEQRLITFADLHINDILRYVRTDRKRRSYQIASAPQILGGTTDIIKQYVVGAATE